MNTTDLNQILPQEEVHKHFVLEGSRLYRKLASGGVQPVKSLDGKQAVTLFKSQRLRGVDIAWCLSYGNWPVYPIVQLRDDPYDFSLGNLFPARVRRLRYEEKRRGNLYLHPLSSLGHMTSERCRADWEEHAAQWYSRDLQYVLRLEEHNRKVRANTLHIIQEHRRPVAEETADQLRVRRMTRPRDVAGREWHWVKDQWIDIPVACHVADDYRVRIAATQDGATWFQFDPDAQMVRAYMPDGTLWTLAK